MHIMIDHMPEKVGHMCLDSLTKRVTKMTVLLGTFLPCGIHFV